MAVSIVTVLLLAALFAGDSVWTALAALLVAGGWSALALAGRAPQPGGGAVLLGVLLANAAWAGLSIAWSVAPDSSWDELNRTLVFAAFLVVGLLLGAGGPRACRLALAALVAALGAAVVWALAGKAIPALFADGGRTARLRDPIGYWNALALAADMLLVLALQLAAAARSRVAVARRGDARLRGDRRGAPGRLASGRRSGGARRRALALARPRPRRGCAADACGGAARCGRSGLGVQPPGARRRRLPPGRARRRRGLVRAAASARRRSGRARRARS